MPKPIVPSMPKKQQFTAAGTKRKQLSLDSLLPKKEISDTQEPHTSNIEVIPPTSLTNNTPNCKTSHHIKPIKGTTSSNVTLDSSCGTVNTNHPKDIFNYINRASTLSNAEKYDVLSNTWKPD